MRSWPLSRKAASGSARFVGPLDRILYLRSLPSISEATIEDLASLAEYLEERTYRQGQPLIRGDRPVESIHFVVSGMVRTTFRDVTIGVIEPPEGVGFLGFLSRQPSGYEAIAEVDTRTLAVDKDVFVGFLEDRFALMFGSLRQVSTQLLELEEQAPDVSEPLPEDEGDPPTKPFDLVERLVWMSQRGVFANSNLDAVMALAREQEERRWRPGERIWNEGDSADYGFVIRHGRVRTWTASGRTIMKGTGFGIGFLEGMAGVPRPTSAEAETEVVALVDRISTVVDVLEDNSDLAFDLSASLATWLLERLAGTST